VVLLLARLRQAKQRAALLKALAGSLGCYQKPVSLDDQAKGNGRRRTRAQRAPPLPLTLFNTLITVRGEKSEMGVP